MLARKKEDWDIYYQQTAQPEAPVTAQPEKLQQPRLNCTLRAECFITVLVAAVMAVTFTVRSEEIIHSGYKLVQMKAQLATVEKDNERLHLDIAKLKAPQRIEQIATTELGMVVPNSVYYTMNKTKPAEATAESKQSVSGQLAGLLKTAKAEAGKAR